MNPSRPPTDPRGESPSPRAARRRHARVVTRGLRIVLLGWPLPAGAPLAMVNISRSGTALLARHVLGDVDAVIAMSLLDADDDTAIPLDGRIRYVIGERSDPDLLQPRWLHGVEFCQITPADEAYLMSRVARRVPIPES